jgi:hypothetical protein
LGGECAGAAAAVVASEAFVLVAMISRFGTFPLDARNMTIVAKSVGLGAVVLVVDRLLRGLGPSRLAADAVLFPIAALGIGLVKIEDIRRIVYLLRHKGEEAAPASQAASGS